MKAKVLYIIIYIPVQFKADVVCYLTRSCFMGLHDIQNKTYSFYFEDKVNAVFGVI